MALKAGTDMACTEYSGHINESLAQACACLALHDKACGPLPARPITNVVQRFQTGVTRSLS